MVDGSPWVAASWLTGGSNPNLGLDVRAALVHKVRPFRRVGRNFKLRFARHADTILRFEQLRA
jgi:hypothetical protein